MREQLGKNVKDAVITVPAYFTEAQREDTRKAGEAAGLNVLRLIPEPTAAAIAYGLDQSKDQTIMVYDLGGGTFDVSILVVRGNSFETKAVGGDISLGGDDFDQALVDWSCQKFKTQTGIDLKQRSETNKEASVALQRLKEAAEVVKIELSAVSDATLSLGCLGHPLELTITRSEYNNLIEPFLQRTINIMKSVLHDAGLKAQDIDRVILVGGSTHTPEVREILKKEIKEPYSAERVDLIVSHGAALLAANLCPSEGEAPPPSIKQSEVTAHSLGINMLDQNDKLFFKPIIPRQTTYPCRLGVLGYTKDPMQIAVQMKVYRGENKEPNRNTYLGELQLPVSKPQREQVPVGAIFDLDADGIIHFTGVDLPVGQDSKLIKLYASHNDSALDLTSADALIDQGKAQTRVVKIERVFE